MTDELLDEIIRVGRELPVTVAKQLAAGCDIARIQPVHRREAVARLIRNWGDRPLAELSAALLTASVVAERQRREQIVELVWTGPESRVVPVRQTEQVILDVIAGACKSLLIISYAVYKIPRICDALLAAARRSVNLTIVLDIADPEFQNDEYNPLGALGPEVVGCARICYWPREKRPVKPDGSPGLLHVKYVGADGTRMFVSSANLTQYAFGFNMELGLLVTGSRVAEQIPRHIDELLANSTLRVIAPAAAMSAAMSG